MSKRKTRFVDLPLCPLPVDAINITMEMELDPGDVVLSRGAQKHALSSHPAEFAACLPHVAAVIADPLYVGDDFKNPGSIELIGRVAAIGSFMLVAVTVTLDAAGHYNVCSFYPITDKKIQPRRERGFLKVVRHKR